jgi:hypothetical protein
MEVSPSPTRDGRGLLWWELSEVVGRAATALRKAMSDDPFTVRLLRVGHNRLANG